MKIHFGVDYYPEHWPEERWETDARLMREMGIQVVRMAEFSWHKLEPEEGRYDFSWLDRAVSLLADYGIKTVLGTPSAAPPAWMINRYPDILPVDREGKVRGFGGRHHDCQSNPVYRAMIRRMVTAMAEHYGGNTNVIGWQPDNELGNSHQDLCMCDHCRSAFQSWLKRKYQTVDRLNEAWGTAFWSQEYNDFAEVFTPKVTVTGENPSAMLDWKCFCSDLIVDFLEEQTKIIRKLCPNQFITHNYMGFANKVDYYDLSVPLDFVSHDQYPGGFSTSDTKANGWKSAANLDVVRSYKNKNFWIMEQKSGITGWQLMGRAPAPGQLSAWALQSVAHGADCIVFFRWRVCAMGTEQYWHGILPHSGNPGRRYYELQATVKDMTPIMERIQGSMPRPETGIVFSFRQEYALQIQPHHPDLSYTGQVQKYYKALYEKNIPVDFVPEDGDFGRYKLLIAPLQYLMNPNLEEKYFDYVRKGGRLVLTMRTGVKDEHNICMTDRELPGRLTELTGTEVLDYDCLRGTDVPVRIDGREYTAALWSDLMRVTKDSVSVLAEYAGEFYSGTPCITVNSYGDGICYYVGTEPGEELMNVLMERMTKEAGVECLGDTEYGVELSARENEHTRWLFAVNHTNRTKTYHIDPSYHMIRGREKDVLEGFEVQILEKSL